MLYEKALSRRKFVAGASALGAVTAIAGCNDNSTVVTTTTATPTTTPVPTTTPTTTPTPAPAISDNDILNFALNLEYLEAQFYLYAATGAGLAVTDIGAGTSTTGTGAGAVILPAGTTGAQLKVTQATTLQAQILAEIAFDEQSHVKFLRSVLGTAAVAMPAIDLSFFGPLAVAAKITTVPTGAGSFTPFGGTFDAFLVGAFIFEDVGVTAYSGAAPLISVAGDTNGYLLAAAGILAVEAYHAAYVRTTITGNAITAGSATAYPYITYANQVSSLRATLGGGNETPLSLPTVSGTTFTPSSIVAATAANAIAYARTTDQVLHIVYGNAAVGTKSGGFFPNGTNGNISATTT